MSETLQAVGLFAIAILCFGAGTLFFGTIINSNEYINNNENDDAGMYCGAWLTGAVVYAITVVMMWSRG